MPECPKIRTRQGFKLETKGYEVLLKWPGLYFETHMLSKDDSPCSVRD